MNDPSQPTPVQHSGGPELRDGLVRYRWPIAFLLVVLMVLASGVWIYFAALRQMNRTASRSVELATGAAVGAGRMIEGLLSGDVTETFISALPTVSTPTGGNLEVAISEVVETFTRSDERRVLWDAVSLGTTISEIKVPVTYRYHLRLHDRWQVEIDEGLCLVRAPMLRPSLPPALHTDRMEKRTEADWLRFDADQQLSTLEQSLTPRLTERAGNPRHLDLVRNQARVTVAEFVRTWLLNESAWGEDRVRAIKVIFLDEEPIDPERIGVSILLGDRQQPLGHSVSEDQPSL